ncbi:hypothetical protein [Streptomyces griseorubiginosus]|uniref:hypothetical protein n=1 Tax=Streptomyces griseorubiginosus TaxID=67304 RepID=UPI003409B72D
MGTSLTPDFWRLFAVLLVIFTAATVVTSALLDALIVRMLRHRRPAVHRNATADRFERHLAHH